MSTPHVTKVAVGVYGLTVGRVFPSNVYFVVAGATWVLVDAGYANSDKVIHEAAESVFGPGTRPAAILLTHNHPDHSGAAPQLARKWDVPIFVSSDELPMTTGGYAVGDHPPEDYPPMDRRLIIPLVRLLPRGMRARMRAAKDLTGVVRSFEPREGVPELPDWQCVPTPGHTPGHVAFFRSHDHVLISGDAVLNVNANSLWDMLRRKQTVSGPPWYFTWSRLTAVRSIAALAALEPRILATGHGEPLARNVAPALKELTDELTRAAGRRQRRLRPPEGFFRPVDYSRSGRYRRPPKAYVRMQWLGFLLTRLGLSPRYVVTLEVPGRKTGQIRRTNLVQVTHNGERYLVALGGESEWVRNVRAANGRVVISRQRRRRPATLVEVPPHERPAVIRAYLLRAGHRVGSKSVTNEARYFFGLGPDPSRVEIRQVADRYPVFRIEENRVSAPDLSTRGIKND